MDILPARPLRLRRSFVVRSLGWGLLWVIVGLAVIVGYLLWAGGDAMRIVQDGEVWRTGVAAEGRVEGRVRSRYGIFKEYNLDVAYTDARGQGHRDRLEFSTLFSGVDQDEPCQLRVDPAEPSRYALSWAVECAGGRWASFVFMAVVGSLIGGCVVFLGWALLDRLRLARRVAAASLEVECRVLAVTEQVVNGRPNGHLIYRFVLPALPDAAQATGSYREAAAPPRAPLEREAVFRSKDGTPLFTDEQGTHLLALVAPTRPTKPLVLRHDLYPFDLGEAEAAAVHARLVARARAEAQALASA